MLFSKMLLINIQINRSPIFLKISTKSNYNSAINPKSSLVDCDNLNLYENLIKINHKIHSIELIYSYTNQVNKTLLKNYV